MRRLAASGCAIIHRRTSADSASPAGSGEGSRSWPGACVTPVSVALHRLATGGVRVGDDHLAAAPPMTSGAPSSASSCHFFPRSCELTAGRRVSLKCAGTDAKRTDSMQKLFFPIGRYM